MMTLDLTDALFVNGNVYDILNPAITMPQCDSDEASL